MDAETLSTTEAAYFREASLPCATLVLDTFGSFFRQTGRTGSVEVMKKSIFFLILSIIGVVLASRYFHLDSSWLTSASGDDSGNISDMNQPMPHVVLPAVTGDWVDMKRFEGKVVLISFWTTWCPGCRDEMPELIQLQQKFGSEGFTVVAISIDDQGEEPVKTFIQTERFQVDGLSAAVNFPVLLGDDDNARKLGFEGGLPASVLVTRDAKEVTIIRGPFTVGQVSKAIQRLL